MLDTQYRMHPAISRFPSSEFYNFTLQDGTIDPVGNIHPRLKPPSSRHLRVNMETGHRPSVIFLDHTGPESAKDRSRVNRHDARIVCSVVEDLLLHNPVSFFFPNLHLIKKMVDWFFSLFLQDLRGEDIGIIAPYAAQISLLTRIFKTDAEYKKRFKAVLGDHRAMQFDNIEIKTVDGFEGREKEIIIFSTVRNNPGGYIGFLADRRRLNVGLTRAKRGLFIVGSLQTLQKGNMGYNGHGDQAILTIGKGADSWKRYAKFLSDEGLVVKLDGWEYGMALYGTSAAERLALALRR